MKTRAATLSWGTGLGDDGAAVGVPDQNDGSVDRVEHLAGGGVVVGERLRGVLHDPNLEAVGAEHVVDTAPTGSVDESAVDQDDGRTHADSFARGCVRATLGVSRPPVIRRMT